MSCTVVSVGDACLSVVFEEKVDVAVNARCVALAAEVERRALPGVRDVVPAFHTISIYFDPRRADRRALQTQLESLATLQIDTSALQPTSIEIAVSYGGVSGPDLASVATFAGCSEAEVIRLHTEAVYRVYMLGFLPGFAYMGTVDRQIAMPRLDTPRLRVAAGSVGIAGVQTGIYPCDTPGGWRIIGRTTTKVFDAAGAEPSLFKAGDRVTFVAV